MSEKRPNVLVAPLDWGMGHATRCVPLINAIIREKSHVIIATHGRAEIFLKEEFPDLEFVASPGYTIKYSKKIPMWLMMIIQSPKILLNIYREHHWLSKFIDEKNIEEVYSDNRYGLWSKKIRTVFMTHQLMIKCPKGLKFMEPVLHFVILWFVKKYSACFVPDWRNTENLSGDLSHKYKLPENIFFTGILSRFESPVNESEIKPIPFQEGKDYAVCFMLSGPEPQRTELENKILSIKDQLKEKAILIQGIPSENYLKTVSGKLTIVNHLKSKELKLILQKAEIIICRAGYSSIMDLSVLEKSGILIPTPGQTEQEYLAEHLSEQGLFISIKQENFEKEIISAIDNRQRIKSAEEKTAQAELNEYSV